MASYTFLAFFTKSKVGAAPANAPTVDVCNVGTNALVVTGGSPTAVTALTGLYAYTYTGATGLRLVAAFKTADTTVDLQHVPSYTPTEITDNLDAAVSTRLATTGYSAPPSAAAYTDERAAKLDLIAVGSITVTAPVTTDGTAISLVYGDDYYNADGRALTFTSTDWPTLTGGSVALKVDGASVTGIAGTITGAQTCRFELSSLQVAGIGVGSRRYDLEAILVTSAHVVTLAQGYVTVSADVR